MDLATLEIRIQTAEAKQAAADLKALETQAGHTSKATDGLSAGFKSLATAAVAFVSVGAVVSFLKDCAVGAMEAEAAQNKLAMALKNQRQYSEAAMQDLNDYAAALQETTTAEDDLTVAVMANLKTYGMSNAEVKRATQTALDFAAAKKDEGMTVQTAADLLGKAYAGSTAALSRYGIVISENLSKTEKYEAVQKQLQDRFGGSSQAELDTYAGKLKQLGNQFDSLKDNIGKIVLSLTEGLIPLLGETAKYWAEVLTPKTQGQTVLDTLTKQKQAVLAQIEALKGLAKISSESMGEFAVDFGGIDENELARLQANLKTIEGSLESLKTKADEAGKSISSMADPKDLTKSLEVMSKDQLKVYEDLTKNINKLRMTEYEFQIWALNEETKARIESSGNNQKIIEAATAYQIEQIKALEREQELYYLNIAVAAQESLDKRSAMEDFMVQKVNDSLEQMRRDRMASDLGFTPEQMKSRESFMNIIAGVEVDAALEASLRANEEYAAKNAKAIIDETEQLTKDMERSWDQMARNIQDIFGDAIGDMLKGEMKDWEDYGQAILDIMADTMAQIISMFLQNKIIMPIVTEISGGFSSLASSGFKQLTSFLTSGVSPISGGGMGIMDVVSSISDFGSKLGSATTVVEGFTAAVGSSGAAMTVSEASVLLGQGAVEGGASVGGGGASAAGLGVVSGYAAAVAFAAAIAYKIFQGFTREAQTSSVVRSPGVNMTLGAGGGVNYNPMLPVGSLEEYPDVSWDSPDLETRNVGTMTAQERYDNAVAQILGKPVEDSGPAFDAWLANNQWFRESDIAGELNQIFSTVPQQIINSYMEKLKLILPKTTTDAITAGFEGVVIDTSFTGVYIGEGGGLDTEAAFTAFGADLAVNVLDAITKSAAKTLRSVELERLEATDMFVNTDKLFASLQKFVDIGNVAGVLEFVNGVDLFISSIPLWTSGIKDQQAAIDEVAEKEVDAVIVNMDKFIKTATDLGIKQSIIDDTMQKYVVSLLEGRDAMSATDTAIYTLKARADEFKRALINANFTALEADDIINPILQKQLAFLEAQRRWTESFFEDWQKGMRGMSEGAIILEKLGWTVADVAENLAWAVAPTTTEKMFEEKAATYGLDVAGFQKVLQTLETEFIKTGDAAGGLADNLAVTSEELRELEAELRDFQGWQMGLKGMSEFDIALTQFGLDISGAADLVGIAADMPMNFLADMAELYDISVEDFKRLINTLASGLERINEEKTNLEKEWLTLIGDEIALRELERDTIDSSNQPLYDRIQYLNDEKEILESLSGMTSRVNAVLKDQENVGLSDYEIQKKQINEDYLNYIKSIGDMIENRKTQPEGFEPGELENLLELINNGMAAWNIELENLAKTLEDVFTTEELEAFLGSIRSVREEIQFAADEEFNFLIRQIESVRENISNLSLTLDEANARMLNYVESLFQASNMPEFTGTWAQQIFQAETYYNAAARAAVVAGMSTVDAANLALNAIAMVRNSIAQTFYDWQRSIGGMSQVMINYYNALEATKWSAEKAAQMLKLVSDVTKYTALDFKNLAESMGMLESELMNFMNAIAAGIAEIKSTAAAEARSAPTPSYSQPSYSQPSYSQPSYQATVDNSGAINALTEKISDLTSSINSLESALDAVQDMIDELTFGKLAPVSSREKMQYQYDKLFSAIGTALTEEDKAEATSEFTQFIPDYLDFMNKFGDNYQTLVDGVLEDLKGLETNFLTEIDYLAKILETNRAMLAALQAQKSTGSSYGSSDSYGGSGGMCPWSGGSQGQGSGGLYGERSAFERVLSGSSSSGSSGGTISSSGSVQYYASGGDFPGGIGMFGEEGPELRLSGPARILSNKDTVGVIADAVIQASGNNDQIMYEIMEYQVKKYESVSSKMFAMMESQSRNYESFIADFFNKMRESRSDYSALQEFFTSYMHGPTSQGMTDGFQFSQANAVDMGKIIANSIQANLNVNDSNQPMTIIVKVGERELQEIIVETVPGAIRTDASIQHEIQRVARR